MKAGTWSLATGKAVQSSTTGQTYLRLPMLVTRAYVWASYTPNTLGGGGAPAAGIRVKNTHEVGCAVFKAMGNVQVVAETDQTDNNLALWAGTFPGAAITIVQNLVAANNCTFTSGAVVGTRQSNYPAMVTPSGYVELSQQDASATYDYVFVVETSP